MVRYPCTHGCISIKPPFPFIHTHIIYRAPQVVAPGSKPRPQGERMAASYINFYIANGGVVMPAFGGEADEADERWGGLGGVR